MRRILKLAVGSLAGLLLLAGALYGWASVKSSAVLSRTVESHTADFPIPFPLPPELEGVDTLTDDAREALALELAVERGRHLVRARYGCADCHGEDFGGGVMVDAPAFGRILGPNLTTGAGSRTLDYTAADWDRVVRHGILPDGRPTLMPAQDFQRMSDRELSDIVSYIRSLPPVDNEVPPVRLGPVAKALVATGKLPLAADMLSDHRARHPLTPPEAAATEEFGRHLAGVCVGCLGENVRGGPIASGDPGWPPAANLTPHDDGLAGWSYDDFVAAMREGVRPDGTELRLPMTMMVPAARNMTDVEMEALWLYLTSVPGVPGGE